MAILDTIGIKYQFSGGITNEDPNLSLGGQISTATNRNIRTNVLHNLYDEVTNAEAVAGEHEVRHFYFRNGHTFKLQNARLIVIADTTSIWSKVEFAKGTANNGNVEQAVPNENTLPVGISDDKWKIPNASNPLVLGDVDAGGTASIWTRRKVEKGALIARNEKVHIRIIADPPIPVTPPQQCPTGEHFDPTTQQCVPDTVTCPPGQHLENGQCVPDGSPPPPPVQGVKAVVVGDIGCSGNADTLIEFVAASVINPDLFVANGDLSYSSTRNCFTDILESTGLRPKTKISIGNHDDEEDGSASLRSAFISYFGIPSGAFYSFNIQNIHFLVMDTQGNYASSSAQFTFARNDLLAASQNAAIDWIVVCYHKPSMTISSNHSPLTDFRDLYHPLFDQFKVDLVIAGHNHNMQRTLPVKHNTSSPSSPTVVNSNANTYSDVDGRIFLVSGAGGRSHHDLGSPPSHFVFSDDNTYGFLLLEWTGNNKTLTGRFIASNSGHTIDIMDQFTVTKTI